MSNTGNILTDSPIIPQFPQTKGTIKYRLRFLRATFGDVLNLWPRYAQEEYTQLSRQLRQLEYGVRK